MYKNRIVSSLAFFLLLTACGGSTQNKTSTLNASAKNNINQGDSDSDTFSQGIASPLRSSENRARDSYRHPKETLEFFGIKPQHTVVELVPGRGWYTEILAPALKDQGKLVVVVPDISSFPEKYRTYAKGVLDGYNQMLESNPDTYGKVESVTVHPLKDPKFGPEASADAVLTFRNVHNWSQMKVLEPMLKAAYAVLKPGGILGVTDHRVDKDHPAAEGGESGYLSEDYVIAQAGAVGFKLAGKSEINANPKDTKDHPDGVWSLPPTLKAGDKDRAKYEAIGESDRMTLKFMKPQS